MKYLIRSIIVVIACATVISCDDMYSIHQKYLDEGEKTYIGYPSIVEANAGYERIRLVWKLNSDPKINESCIYWNNRQDSVTVPVNRTDSVMRVIIPLSEGKYNLEIVNKSADGLRSLTNTASVESYGETYRNNLYNRIVTAQVAAEDNITLTWSVEEGCIGAEMRYINKHGQEKEIFVAGNQTILVIDDYKPGGSFTYASLYIPEESAIDTISASSTTEQFAMFYREIDRTGWTITASSTGGSFVAGNLLDGNIDTMWHSNWGGASSEIPYTLAIDMQQVYAIDRISFSRRNSDQFVTDTRTIEVEAKEKAEDEFVFVGEYKFGTSTDLTGVFTLPETVNARYVNIIVTEEGRDKNASLSEIRFYEQDK